MSFTYDISTAAGQVRYLIGDTLSTDPLANADDEIAFCLSANNSDVYRSAAFAARAWAAKINQAISVDQGSKGWKLDRDAQAKALIKRAAELDAQAVTLSGVTPFAGGISVADKQAREGDADRVQPGNTVANQRTPGLPNSGDGTNTEPTRLGWQVW